MNLFWTTNLLFIFIGLFPDRNDGLHCYACASSSSGEECEVGNNELIRQRFEGGPYHRQCTGIGQRYCMIEHYKTTGRTISFIRDCSNGRTFSETTNANKRLQRVQPNNQTVCSVYNGDLICLSLCSTDFCNGPQEGTTAYSAANSTGVNTSDRIYLMLINAIILYMYLSVHSALISCY